MTCDQQPAPREIKFAKDHDRLDRYVCAALTGLCANPNPIHTDNISIAKAAIASAKAAMEAADKEMGK